jgi:hypothetical protein
LERRDELLADMVDLLWNFVRCAVGGWKAMLFVFLFVGFFKLYFHYRGILNPVVLFWFQISGFVTSLFFAGTSIRNV